METQVKYFQAAGITVQVNSDFPISEHTFHPKFKRFETSGPGKDTVIINHHFCLPDLKRDPGLVENELYRKDQWHIYKTGSNWVYCYHPVFPEDPPRSVTGIFNHDHTLADIYTSDITEAQYRKGQFSALTLFNTDQILFAKLLCSRNGLIFHSNGFDVLGRGVLLTGDSGSGKSTLSAMLQKKGFQILCDDRMFVTQRDKKFFIHGNWCHGTVAAAYPGTVPLRAILFLEQSQTNSIEIVNKKFFVFQKTINSMVKSFLNTSEWKAVLSMLEKLIEQTPCYQLKFDLSGNICDLITDTLILDHQVF